MVDYLKEKNPKWKMDSGIVNELTKPDSELLSAIGCKLNQALFAYYLDWCPETKGSPKYAYLKAYPGSSLSTANHASSKLKEPGVNKARLFFRDIQSGEYIRHLEKDPKVMTVREALIELSDMAYNRPDENGIRPYPAKVKFDACKEILILNGAYNETGHAEKGIKDIVINFNQLVGGVPSTVVNVSGNKIQNELSDGNENA